MGAVHRHNFEIVRKGYEPDAVDEVILGLTIAKNDSEAMVTRLQKQIELGVSDGPASSTGGAPAVAEAKAEARRIIDEAHHQAETTIAGARTEASKLLGAARFDAQESGSGLAAGSRSQAELARLLLIAETFESQLTQIARGALGDVGTLTKDLKGQLDLPAATVARPPSQPKSATKAATPAPPAQPARSATAVSAGRPAAATEQQSEGGNTLDRLRRLAADSRTDQSSMADHIEPPVEPATPAARPTAERDHPEESTSLAARIAREKRTESGSAVEESTSRADRIAREDKSASEKTEEDRGSFYSRRSARLRRIGEEGTASALASIRSVRKGSSAASDDNDMAAQTA